MTSSSNASLSDLEVNQGDTGEGVEVRIKASIINCVKIHSKLALPEQEPELRLDEINLEDWEDDPNTSLKAEFKPSEKKDSIAPRHKFSLLFEEKRSETLQKTNINTEHNQLEQKINLKDKPSKVTQNEEFKIGAAKPEASAKVKNRTFTEFLCNVQKFDKKKQENMKEKLVEEDLKFQQTRNNSNPKLHKKLLAKVGKQSGKRVAKKIVFQSFDTESSTNKKIELPLPGLFRQQSADRVFDKQILYKLSKSPTDLFFETKKTGSLVISKSEKFLVSKFKRNFLEQFEKLDVENSLTLNYSKFLILMQNLGFTSKCPLKVNTHRKLCIEIWNLIGGFQENCVRFSNLLSVLLCVMNFKDTALPTHQNLPSFGCLIKGVFCVTNEEILKIHQKFLPLFEEKTFIRPKSLEVSFQTRKTKKKANSMREEELIYGKKRLISKQDFLKQKKSFDEFAECSFQPKIKRGPRTHASSSDLNDTSQSIYSIFSENKNIQNRGDILYEYSKLHSRQTPKFSNSMIESPINKRSFYKK